MAPIETLATSAPPAPTQGTLPAATPQVQIRSFQTQDLKAVEELFAAGMLFYAADYPHLLELWQGYVSESINDDIAKIEDVYMKPGGNFWVATIDENANGHEKVIGMVALEAKGEREGELRRMSVNAAYRRYGLGRKLVTHLEQWAKANDYKRVWLSTGAVMTHAAKFYPSIGYKHFKTEVVSEDPHFEALFFAKDL